MSQDYQKVQNTKRVSFDQSTRFDYEAPRPVNARPSFNAERESYIKDESDDEIDTLLADDPLHEEKTPGRKASRAGKRLGRKKRRVLILGLVSLLLTAIVAVVVVSCTSSLKKPASLPESDKVVAAEIGSMTEVPTLIGVLPLNSADLPVLKGIPDFTEGSNAPTAHDESKQGEIDSISVPPTDIDWDNEETHRAAYEAGASMDDIEYTHDSPPELSPEAVAQAQAVNTKLDEASAAVAQSASESTQHKDALQSLKNTANDLVAWLNATWEDIMSNKATAEETIY